MATEPETVRHVNPLAPASLILAVCGAAAAAGWMLFINYGSPLANSTKALLAVGFVGGVTLVGWLATLAMGVVAGRQIRRSYGCQSGAFAAFLAVLVTLASMVATGWFLLNTPLE